MEYSPNGKLLKLKRKMNLKKKFLYKNYIPHSTYFVASAAVVVVVDVVLFEHLLFQPRSTCPFFVAVAALPASCSSASSPPTGKSR